jgi:uncharacterized protein related to proFAR isomerase
MTLIAFEPQGSLPTAVPMIPVLDLQAGRAVHARGGRREAYRPIVGDDGQPQDLVALAEHLLRAARSDGLYVADLDAIAGGAPQAAALDRLRTARGLRSIWIDAGFAGSAAARSLIADLGHEGPAVRPVFGSESLRSASELAEIAADPAAILSLDHRGGEPMDPAGCLQRPALWPATVLVMSLDRVGSAAGPDLPTFNRCREIAGPSPPRRWIGAGGVRDAADLQAAHRAGAAGWLVATALMRFAALPQAESVSPQAASGPTRAASLRIEAASVRIQAASLRR